jgi:hypothetical protein
MTDPEKIAVATVTLMVTRDSMTRLPVTVPAHELEVMQALHGTENVQELDEKPAPVMLDPATEGERLQQKYGRGLIAELYGAAPARKVAAMCKEHEVKAKPAKTDKTPA